MQKDLKRIDANMDATTDAHMNALIDARIGPHLDAHNNYKQHKSAIFISRVFRVLASVGVKADKTFDR